MEWTYYNLGISYRDQDRFAAAERMYKGAVRDYEKAIGPDNTFDWVAVGYAGMRTDA